MLVLAEGGGGGGGHVAADDGPDAAQLGGDAVGVVGVGAAGRGRDLFDSRLGCIGFAVDGEPVIFRVEVVLEILDQRVLRRFRDRVETIGRVVLVLEILVRHGVQCDCVLGDLVFVLVLGKLVRRQVPVVLGIEAFGHERGHGRACAGHRSGCDRGGGGLDGRGDGSLLAGGLGHGVGDEAVGHGGVSSWRGRLGGAGRLCRGGLCRDSFGDRLLGDGRLDDRLRRGGGRRNGRRGGEGGGAQVDGAVLGAGLDPAGDLALGDAGQHLGVGLGRLGPEIAVVRCQIPEILGDRLHRAEAVVESFQRARECAVGDRQDLARSNHVNARLPVLADAPFTTALSSKRERFRATHRIIS